MTKIDKKTAPSSEEIDIFLKQVNFNLPKGFIEFFTDANGADIITIDKYILLWALTDMMGFGSKIEK
ncbi:MAG: hypothetical protein NW218_00435 [Saprospiraceae bacterium]|nr:hypothetical protein [Saprospiraceae bacterium]